MFCKALRLACFEAGTPIQGEHGPVPVEQVRAGTRVWARPEGDPEAPAELKVVEEAFDRHAAVLRLRLPGGVQVGTTFEHPFWVTGREWVPAGELRAGDMLVGRDGERVAVEGVEETAEWKPVYNFRVADYHTYYVGAAEWGYTVWAHNAKCRHELSWELRGPRGGLLNHGDEISGLDFALPKGWKMTFPEQALHAHTEGKVISELIELRQLGPMKMLVLEGRLPPCSGCRTIMAETSAKHKMTVQYTDATGQIWTWANGVLLI